MMYTHNSEEQRAALDAYEYLLKIESYKRELKCFKPGSKGRKFWIKIIKTMEAQAALIEREVA